MREISVAIGSRPGTQLLFQTALRSGVRAHRPIRLISLVVVAPLTFLSPVLGQVVGTLLQLPVQIAGVAAMIVTYAECRFHEHNPVHTPVLADEIDRA